YWGRISSRCRSRRRYHYSVWYDHGLSPGGGFSAVPPLPPPLPPPVPPPPLEPPPLEPPLEPPQEPPPRLAATVFRNTRRRTMVLNRK
ncbi:hypothetical protein NW766_010758, partial [Fusarium irregulare]